MKKFLSVLCDAFCWSLLEQRVLVKFCALLCLHYGNHKCMLYLLLSQDKCVVRKSKSVSISLSCRFTDLLIHHIRALLGRSTRTDTYQHPLCLPWNSRVPLRFLLPPAWPTAPHRRWRSWPPARLVGVVQKDHRLVHNSFITEIMT